MATAVPCITDQFHFGPGWLVWFCILSDSRFLSIDLGKAYTYFPTEKVIHDQRLGLRNRQPCVWRSQELGRVSKPAA
jgi:hypothetical protein